MKCCARLWLRCLNVHVFSTILTPILFVCHPLSLRQFSLDSLRLVCISVRLPTSQIVDFYAESFFWNKINKTNSILSNTQEQYWISHEHMLAWKCQFAETFNNDNEIDMVQFDEVVARLIFKSFWKYRETQDSPQKDYDKRHCDGICFNTGDVVLLRNMLRADGLGGKQTRSWLGPYQIQEMHQSGTYTQRNKKVKLKIKAPGSNLKMLHKHKSQPTKKKDDLHESEVEILN